MYPKQGRGELFERLIKQCKAYEIPIQSDFPADANSTYNLIVDAVFGFSFKPPLRPAFHDLLAAIVKSDLKIVSVDVPSGWSVDDGPPLDETPALQPDCLISLTAPKKTAAFFKGSHWLGGRFVPAYMQSKYQLALPPYPGTECCVLID